MPILDTICQVDSEGGLRIVMQCFEPTQLFHDFSFSLHLVRYLVGFAVDTFEEFVGVGIVAGFGFGIELQRAAAQFVGYVRQMYPQTTDMTDFDIGIGTFA